MFSFDQPWLVAGMALGFASSLHCVGMCSGIATSLCLSAAGPGHLSRSLYATSILINAGRITAYVLAGAIVGGLGAGVFGALDRSLLHGVLRWAAAVSLAWIGLATIGLLPLPTAALGLSTRVSDAFGALAGRLRCSGSATLFASGCMWGFFPCSMVYGALFYAMLTGSALGGATAMLGFGLGTLPAITAAGLGLPWLTRRAKSPAAQRVVGIALIALGVTTLGVPAAAIAELCGFG